MTYNPITYTASGGQTVFNIPFTRISDTYIKVATKLVGATNYITQSVSTNYTIVGNTVVFNIGLDSGVKVRIWRSTNRASLVDFNGVNNLTSSNLGLTTTQQSNIAEEVESDLDDLNAVVDGIVTSVVGFDPDNVSNTYLELQGDVAAAVADLEDATTSFAAQSATVTALDIVKNPALTGNALKIPQVNAGETAYGAVTFNALLPSQTGNAGKLLTTDGTNASWANVPFAYVNFDGTTASNLVGTATRASNVATINATAHGHIVGHRVYLTFASGISNGWFTVATVPTANSFTVASTGADVVVPVVATLTRRSIRQSVNVQSVPYNTSTPSDSTLNFSSTYGSTNYAILGMVQSVAPEQLCFLLPQPAIAVKTALHFNFYQAGTGTGSRYESAQIYVAIF
jgi:hypothetical protein